MTGMTEMRGTARQKTLKASVRCRGVGLHTGARVTMILHPAEPDSGVVFRRKDMGGAEIPASWRHLSDAVLCTTVAQDGASVATVEHLMAAFCGLEIDNVIVEIDGPEVPAMDGSAGPFVLLMESVGLEEQSAPRRAIRLLKRVQATGRGSSAMLLPGDSFTMSFAIDFASKVIRRQAITLAPDAESFKDGICRARSFGFLEEVDRMRAAGLARGGSLENAVVVSGDRVLNPEGLRYGDEFVRHKVLDAMGDLYLAGGPIIGHFDGVRSGHALNRSLLERLFADPTAWCHATLPAAPAAAEEWQDLPRRARA
jgi:UDP-3-O-[3-hydroxymyristoyl] N-acetylglucosamine deacetylase